METNTPNSHQTSTEKNNSSIPARKSLMGLIEVPFIHDDHLKEKFISKRDLLLEALKSREIPDKCSDSETWGGIKCERFCPVREFCPHIPPTQ